MIHSLMLIIIGQKVKCRLFLLFYIENYNFQINIYISFILPQYIQQILKTRPFLTFYLLN